MSESLPPAQPETESPEEAKVRRRAKRQRDIQKVLRILGLPIGGIGLAPTIWFVKQQQLGLAILTGFASIGIIFLALTYRYLDDLFNRVFDRIEERLEATTDPFAEWIVAQLEAAVVRLWWKITPQFQGEYYQSLIYEYRTYRTQGLKTPGEFTPDLDKVFVPLGITSRSLEQISPALIQRQEAIGDLEVWDFLAESARETAYKRMVIIGAPGSGKTTLLRHMTLTYAHNTHRQRSRKIPTLVPVLMPLHKILEQITVASPPPLSALIVGQVKTLPRGQLLNLSPQWFESKLLNGKCLVMLDGLDEVADETQRKQVSQWVDSQMRAYPDAFWILTSRPYGYRNARLTEARTTLGVQSFSLKQMEQFLHRWYLQNEILRQVRKRDAGVETAATQKAQDLIGRIKNYPPLAALALNPLLLTMIATVHDNRGALPGNRVELYDEICDVLLVRRQQAKGLTEPFPLKAEQKKSVLQVLALELMFRKRREFSLEQGVAMIEDALGTVAGDGVTPAQFIKHIETVSGLLLEREVGLYQFAHLSFQEYLASAQIKETGQLNLLIENIGQSWWHETIRLYAAKSDTTALIEAALQQPSLTTLTIAYDCLDEGKSLAPETRKRLQEMSLESVDPAIAKLAAEVKLARRLTRLLRIDESVQIDQDYITWAEFRLFLETSPKAGQAILESESSLASPVQGITFEAALEFCVWLKGWELSYFALQLEFSEDRQSYVYRLPTQAEIACVSGQDNEYLDAWTMGCNCLDGLGLRIARQRLTTDYAELYQYLINKDWERADLSTTSVLLQAAKQRKRHELGAADIEAIPASYLQMIDLLWMLYSGGKQGLGMQASIWEQTEAASGKQRQVDRWGSRRNTSGDLLQLNPPFMQYYPRHASSTELLHRFVASNIERRLPLKTFEVVTVNSKGEINQRIQKQNQYFEQDLGNGITLEMMLIPGGTFVMGSPAGEEGRYEDEGPQHEVTVPPFFMGAYSITQAQWRQVAALPQVKRELKATPSQFKRNENHPVEHVSWDDAAEFCDRLSLYTNCIYRLPSEAEWEYACRAGTITPFHFGKTITTDIANYGSSVSQTAQVGLFFPNAFGLYDMHGNVWEWCQDGWHSTYRGAPTDGSAWMRGEKNYRILRGGSWNDVPRRCRSANRDRNARNLIYYSNVGFRVVVSPARESEIILII